MGSTTHGWMSPSQPSVASQRDGALRRSFRVCLVSCSAPENSYAHSHLFRENLIDVVVPFLPLEYHHVKLCARDAFLARGLPYTEATLDEVAQMMVFVPKEEKLFSAQGCKSVPQRINYFLP